MTDVNCPMCGYRVDLLNESQPVCPRCGTDPFESDDSDEDYFEWKDREVSSSEPVLSPPLRGSIADVPALLDKYAKNRAGLGRERSLQNVCLDCRGSSVGRKAGHRECLNPQCGARWYVNHCWQCKEGLDSRDTSARRCPRCKWQACWKCGACKKDCREWQQTSVK